MAQTKYDVRITFQIAKAGNGFKEVQQEIAKTEQTSKAKTKSIFGQWTELRSKILVVKFAIREVANAFNAFYSSARGGAELTQLTESFDRANASIFKTPTLLNDLSVAARGTVTEAELMSGIMTLTAGTSETLSKALTTNAAELLTIAKAANRLNPTLGDTEYFYKSLTTGIKRSSYRILDNLGIVVRVGDANRRWAEEMGRTVDSMTAEERQMALLNETLRVGGRLVQQAGGTSESLTDSYDILKTAVREVSNEMKEGLNRALLPLIKGFADARLAAIEFRAEIANIFTTDYSEDWANNVQIQLAVVRQKLEQFLEDMGFAAQAGMFLRAGQLDQETIEEYSNQLARIFLEADPDLASKFLEQTWTNAEQVSTPTFEAIRNVAKQLNIELSDTLLSGEQGVGAGLELIPGIVIPYYNLEKAVNKLNTELERNAIIQSRLNVANNLALTFGRSDVGLTNKRLDALNELNKELARGVRLLDFSGIKTDDYNEGMRELVAATIDANQESNSLAGVFLGLGFNVDETGISLGGYSATWKEINTLLEQSIGATEEAASITNFLAAQAEYATWAGFDYAQMLDIMAVSSDKAAQAVQDAADELERLRQIDLANIFGELSTGDGELPLFNEELDELGKQLVWVSDSSVTHQQQVSNLQDEYDNIVDTINDYNTYARGASLADDERAEKLQEQYDLLDIVAGRLDDVGGIQGHYQEIVRAATVNEEELNKAIYESIAAKSEDALATGIAGIALGQLTEGQAFALLQYAVMVQKIEQLAQAYVDGSIGAYGLRDGVRSIIDEVENMDNVFESNAQTTDEQNQKYIEFIDNIKNNKPPIIPIEFAVEEDPFKDKVLPKPDETDLVYEYDFVGNAQNILDEELTPVQELLQSIETESPYEFELDDNLADKIGEAEVFDGYLMNWDGKHILLHVDVDYNQIGEPPNIPGGARWPDDAGQHGLDRIVPFGYPNDSFLIGASTGERVTVQTPAQQRAASSVTHGPTYNFYAPVYGEDSMRQMLDEYNEEQGILAKARARTS